MSKETNNKYYLNRFTNLFDILNKYETLNKYENQNTQQNKIIISEIKNKIKELNYQINNNNDNYYTKKTIYKEKKFINDKYDFFRTILGYSIIFLFIIFIILLSIKILGKKI